VSVWPTFVRRRGGARSLCPRAVGGEAFAAAAIPRLRPAHGSSSGTLPPGVVAAGTTLTS